MAREAREAVRHSAWTASGNAATTRARVSALSWFGLKDETVACFRDTGKAGERQMHTGDKQVLDYSTL